MEINYEYEAKLLISEQDYLKLINNLPIKKTIIQTNYYLISQQLTTNQALRIREINNTYTLTLKTKQDNKNEEKNIPISQDIFNEIINTNSINHDLLTQLNLHINTIDNIFIIKTTRHQVDYQNIIVEIDKTTFNNTIDYEIEIEAINLEIANQKMQTFIKEFQITGIPSMPKIARYYQYNQ